MKSWMSSINERGLWVVAPSTGWVSQREKISDQTQVTGRFLGGQGLDETRNQARRAFVLTHLETWCQVNFL